MKYIKNHTNTSINYNHISKLRQAVQSSWVGSVKAVYAFGKYHSKASIEASVKECGLNTTKDADRSMGAAILGLSLCVNDQWLVCPIQASRYAEICKYLRSNSVRVKDVEQFLDINENTKFDYLKKSHRAKSIGRRRRRR